MRSRFIRGVAACSAWLVAIAIGFGILVCYDKAPGTIGMIAYRLPSNQHIAARANSSTLIMFAHPRCPCTRASLEELARIVARGGRSICGFVVFVQPETEGDAWSQTDLWRTASRMPGVQPLVDRGGQLAEKFGAQTSGQVFMYDASGRLQFQGGITPSRGHAGDNYGKSAILSLIQGGRADRVTAPVFGCPLQELQPITNGRTS